MNMYLQTNAQKKHLVNTTYCCFCRQLVSPIVTKNKTHTHACMHRHTQTLTLTHSLTLNNTATGGFRQEGLPRKRWEETLAICVEHIFIWAETERHKNPRRAREVICPDSSFTLPRCNTDARTRMHRHINRRVRAHEHVYTHARSHARADTYRDAKTPTPSEHIKRSKSVVPSQECQQGSCAVVCLCMNAQVSGC